MFNVRKLKQNPIVVIRSATEDELANYEKQRLVNIGDKVQENKITSAEISAEELFFIKCELDENSPEEAK